MRGGSSSSSSMMTQQSQESSSSSSSAAPTNEMDAQLKDAMSQIENQVTKQLDMPVVDAPAVVPSPFDDKNTHPRFKATSSEVVRSLNFLDLKTINAAVPAPVKKAYPRNVVAAYGSVAAETVQKANYALMMLKNQRDSLQATLKIQKHDMLLWVGEQKKNAEAQIAAQQANLGKLEDEISHLQHVYQDAMAKERSYQVQGNMLVSERQLQHTPPVMPAEVATSMSDKDYQSAISKLATYQKAAQSVMTQTAAHIKTRQQMISQTRAWIAKSKETLKNWLALQGGMIAKRTAETEKELSINGQRTKAVVTMSNDAATAFKEYSKTVSRIDINERIKELTEAKKKWDSAKPSSPYDDAQAKSYAVALQLEIDGLKARLKATPGADKVAAPPTVWGVLAGFPSGPKVEFPEPFKPDQPQQQLRPQNMVWLHPAMMPSPIARPNNPAVRYAVPTAAEHEMLDTPMFETDTMMGTGGLLARANFFPHGLAGIAAGAAKSGSASASSSFVEQGATVSVHSAARVPSPPVMPALPPPPDADLVI